MTTKEAETPPAVPAQPPAQENDDKKPSDYLTAAVGGARDVVIIALSLGALIGVVIFAVRHYKDVKDELALLGVVAPTISAIAGVAFGVALGGSSGSAAGKVAAKAAEAQTDQKRAQARQAGGSANALRGRLDAIESQIRKLPSPTASGDFLVTGEQIRELGGQEVRIPAEDLSAAREELARVQASLDAVAR